MKNKARSKGQRGVALVTTIFLLTMFAILVVGFLDSMNTENSASNAIENAQRTKLVAQGAVAHAIDILRTNIPDPAQISEAGGNYSIRQRDLVINQAERPRSFEINSGPAKVAKAELWVTNPGRLTIVNENGQHRYVDLHTGAMNGAPEGEIDSVSFDLNAPIPGETVPAIAASEDEDQDRPEMRVRWVNIIDNPAEDSSPENRIVARYAFWLDDETAKLNFNVANGKPSPREDKEFHEMLEGGMVTPYFFRGSGETRPDGNNTDTRNWSLGHPRSINFDVLFEQADQLNHDDLLDHVWVHGFHRYPEAIKKFVRIGSAESDREWYERNKFNMTFYSRGPEFNPFGRSRLFTTHHPLSLEAGPSYQQVFIFDPNGSGGRIGEDGNEVLSLNSLMGAFGWHDPIDDPDGTRQHAPNMINRLQLEMLVRYMHRKWPGYERSFVDKYGLEGCYQIALNLLNMARFATTGMSGNIKGFTQAWAYRTTSVSYIPASIENGKKKNGNTRYKQLEMRYDGKGENHTHVRQPEDTYWRFKVPGKRGTGENGEFLMIPQSPGPHITEVGIQFRARVSDPGKKVRNSDKTLKIWNARHDRKQRGRLPKGTLPRHIEYRIVGELTASPKNPVMRAREFQLCVDALEIEIEGVGLVQLDRAGKVRPTTAHLNSRSYTGEGIIDIGKFNEDKDLNSTDWLKGSANGRLRAKPVEGLYIGGPETSSGNLEVTDGDGDPVRQRQRFASVWRAVGERSYQVPNYSRSTRKDGTVRVNAKQWRPMLFDAAKGRSAEVKSVKMRVGMGIENAARRTRQMIPLGERSEDMLEWTSGKSVNLLQTEASGGEGGTQFGVYWEINDPNLSAHKDEWKLNPSNDPKGHSLGEVNKVAREPGNESSEKSKYKYIQRSYTNGKWRDYSLNSGDEYWSKSRTSSKGFWSFIHTGIQSRASWQTMDLQSSKQQDSPPDYLLLDLLGATYPMQHQQWRNENTLPDEFSTVSFMNSTAGQVNPNTRIYPQNEYFKVPARTKPLEGVFKHLRPDDQIKSFVESVEQYQTDNEVFEYIGELADVPGYDGNGQTIFEKESLLRNMAGCLTTNSNTFGMWGVAQTVKKSRANESYGEFEDGDRVMAEKRFFAILERYIWPGKDGIPGNAHVDQSGKWDRTAKQNREIILDKSTDRLFQLPGSPPLKRSGNKQTGTNLSIDKSGTYPEYDGPQPVGMDKNTERMLGKTSWRKSSLEEAYNPPQAVVKYRVVYFKYLDE